MVPVEDAVLDIETLTANFRMNEPEFKAALNCYWQQQGTRVPVHSLVEIIAFGQYDKPTLEKFFSITDAYEDGPKFRECRKTLFRRNFLFSRCSLYLPMPCSPLSSQYNFQEPA